MEGAIAALRDADAKGLVIICPELTTQPTTSAERGNYFIPDRHAAVPVARRIDLSDGAGVCWAEWIFRGQTFLPLNMHTLENI